MTISATTNFNFPLLDDSSQNSGAVLNGILEDLDKELYAAQHPLTYENELLVYEGDVLLWYNT